MRDAAFIGPVATVAVLLEVFLIAEVDDESDALLPDLKRTCVQGGTLITYHLPVVGDGVLRGSLCDDVCHLAQVTVVDL